jgi:predicted regulator of Ras-like GTPase activity (Roadblock/LC7/MglB family)
MATLPQLIEEDIQHIDATLNELNTQADAMASLVIDKGGFLITHAGHSGEIDLTTIAALASGAFLANQTIAGLVNEKNFNSTYQQGEHYSLFIINIDEHCLMVVIFKSQSGVGVVKYYAESAVQKIGAQMLIARERDPDKGFDLSVLNVSDPQTLFRRKED